jgi:branched-chain amino acid transport system permease protein
MRACAENKIAAALVGINPKNMVSLAFVISAALGAVAGIIIAPITFTSYDRGTLLGLKGFSAMVLGGLGSSLGAVTGGFLLGLLESMGAGYISSRFKDIIAFLILLTVLFIRPRGIMGKRTLFQ